MEPVSMDDETFIGISVMELKIMREDLRKAIGFLSMNPQASIYPKHRRLGLDILSAMSIDLGNRIN